jgi:membrane-associated phospholipid phosphatase
MNRFFQIISWVFMPLTTPLIGLIIVLHTPTYLDFNTVSNSLFYLDDSVKRFFLNAFALFGWILPVMSILVLKISKQINSIELDDQKQRFTPLFLSGIYAIMLVILLFKFNNQIKLSPHLFSLAFSGMFVAFIFLIINIKFKISLHAAGIGMLIGFLLSYYLEQSLMIVWPIYLAFIVGGFVITSRIWLGKHTNNELICGFICGFIITFITNLLSVYYFNR